MCTGELVSQLNITTKHLLLSCVFFNDCVCVAIAMNDKQVMVREYKRLICLKWFLLSRLWNDGTSAYYFQTLFIHLYNHLWHLCMFHVLSVSQIWDTETEERMLVCDLPSKKSDELIVCLVLSGDNQRLMSLSGDMDITVNGHGITSCLYVVLFCPCPSISFLVLLPISLLLFSLLPSFTLSFFPYPGLGHKYRKCFVHSCYQYICT